MPLNITVTVDQGQIDKVRQALKEIKNGANLALRIALNKGLSSAKTAVSKGIRQDVKLKKAYVDSKLYPQKATIGDLAASLSAERRGVLMTRYPYIAYKKGGVGVQIKPAGGKKKMPGAFVLPSLKNSNVPGIAIRKGGKLDVLHSPSVSQVMVEVKDEVMPDISQVISKELDRQVEVILQKYGGN